MEFVLFFDVGVHFSQRRMHFFLQMFLYTKCIRKQWNQALFSNSSSRPGNETTLPIAHQYCFIPWPGDKLSFTVFSILQTTWSEDLPLDIIHCSTQRRNLRSLQGCMVLLLTVTYLRLYLPLIIIYMFHCK